LAERRKRNKIKERCCMEERFQTAAFFVTEIRVVTKNVL